MRMHQGATTPPRLSTLAIITGLSVLSLNMFLPSLPGMAEDLRTDYQTVSLSIAGYLTVTACLQLILGPLSDRYGRRPVLLGALIIFTAASLGCVLATDVETFLFFRLLQGTIVAGGVLSRAVIRDIARDEDAASMMASVASIMAVAPMLGPMLGGVLEDLLGWRSNFVLYFALGIGVLALCWLDLGETHRPSKSSFTTQFRAYPELLRSRQFVGHGFCMMFATATFYSFIAGVPRVANALFDTSPAMVGFYIGTITAGFVCGSVLSGRSARRHSSTTMILAGRGIALAGPIAGLGLLALGIVYPISFFGATILVGIGNGLTMPGSTLGAMSVRRDLAGSASGLFGALTVLGGAIVTSLTAAAVTVGDGAYALLAIMLLCTAASFGFAVFAETGRIRMGVRIGKSR